jgi:hypothetical protein
MRIKRSIIIPALLMLSAAGSTVAGSAVTLAAGPASGAQVVAMSPNTYYNG